MTIDDKFIRLRQIIADGWQYSFLHQSVAVLSVFSTMLIAIIKAANKTSQRQRFIQRIENGYSGCQADNMIGKLCRDIGFNGITNVKKSQFVCLRM